MARVQKWLGPKSLKSYNSTAFTVPRHWFIILITAAYFCGCFSTSYFARAYLWWLTVHKFRYSCLNVLVQVVLFFTNKTILWKQHAYCMWFAACKSCVILCVGVIRKEIAFISLPKLQIVGQYGLCWVLQTGCSYAAPRNKQYQVQLKYASIKHYYVEMGSSFNTTPSLRQSLLTGMMA